MDDPLAVMGRELHERGAGHDPDLNVERVAFPIRVLQKTPNSAAACLVECEHHPGANEGSQFTKVHHV